MDNATFDRLARMLAGGASRRHTLRAFIAAALAGGTAEELLAAKKDRNKNDDDKQKDGDKDRGGRGRDSKRNGDGGSHRVSAQGKNNSKKKRKRKNKRKPNTGGDSGGNSCAGTPLRPGQDFLGCDFSGRNLRGQDLNSSLFKDVDLTDANLCGANLESTSVADSDLSDANLTDVTLDSSSHSKTSFAGANLTNATLRVATFSKVDFSNADFTGADLTGAAFADADFTGAIFCRTIQPNGNVDDRDCDVCDNTCGLCEACEDVDCTPPDCCPNPSGPGGVCVNLENDPLNCGGCDVPCFDNLANACVDGECVCGNEPKCSNDRTCCPGEEGDAASCKNLKNDTLNCGECGRMCLIPVNPCLAVVCQNGQCVEIPAENGSPCVSGGEGVCCADGNSSTCVVGAECCTQAQCNANQDCCDGQCVNDQIDPNNCGACGVKCAAPTEPCLTAQCIGGSCTDGFAEDGEPCSDGGASGICCFSIETSLCIVDVDDNFDHCGGCIGCDPDKADACNEGTCVCGSGQQCGASQTCCNGQCVNTNTDRENCGACEVICLFPANPCRGVECVNGSCQESNLPDGTDCEFEENSGVCCGGSCAFGDDCCSNAQCGPGTSCCGGQCLNTTTNFDRCGSCTNVCPQDRATACVGGACVCGSFPVCAPNEFCCPDGCFDTDTDVDNCGGCGDGCLANADTCANGECVCGDLGFACPEGNRCCGGDCADTNSDFDHCGICGNACDSDAANACVNGICVCGLGPACGANEKCCGNQCIDITSDRFNCGDCGAECVDGVCNNSSCEPCDGIPCGSECLTDGENVCCVPGDCTKPFCQKVVGCSEEHVCLFANEPAGTLCGSDVCDGEGNCIPAPPE